MDVSELRQLISKPEWADVELKAAANKYPKEALSSVSAFSNSGGGYLIFGIDERKDNPVTGVQKVDEVQNAFIGLLKDTNKFSTVIRFNVELFELDGEYILVFQIQEALRHEKPIYLNGDMKQTYLRKGGRDDKATDEEIKRMVRDADLHSRDEQLLDIDPETCFELSTLKWYRHIYERRFGEKYHDLYHLEFLEELALIKEQDDELKPTLAAVLMFGTEKHIRQLLPRFTLDAYWHHSELEQSVDATRWNDRRSFECNLFDTWRQLAERFMYFAEKPFLIDETNLQRKNETPDYIGFREAAVNALIHQDYSDTRRIATVHFYKNASIYFNPGDSLVDIDRLGKGDSAARNPLIMQTFHRIGLSDRAGSGIRDIRNNWQQLNRPDPIIENNKSHKTFQITLGKKAVVSQLQETLEQRAGVKLSELQANVFISCLITPKTVDQIAESKQLAPNDVYPLLDYLSRQGLLVASQDGYMAPEHFCQALADLAPECDQSDSKVTNLELESDQPQVKVTNLKDKSDQPEVVLAGLSKKQIAIIRKLSEAMSLAELMGHQGHKTYFKKNHLQPLIDKEIVALTYPDNPHHQDQGYILTEFGLVVRSMI